MKVQLFRLCLLKIIEIISYLLFNFLALIKNDTSCFKKKKKIKICFKIYEEY